MEKKEIGVYGYDGTVEELQRELQAGLDVVRVIEMPGGGKFVSYVPQKQIGRPARYDKAKIIELRKKGMSYKAIAEEIGCSKTYAVQICKENEKI